MSETIPPQRQSAKVPEAFVMRTRLHFMRHGKKAGGNGVPQAEDLAMHLTPAGRDESRVAGQELERIEGSWEMASGSPRRRAQETAYLEKLAQDDRLTGTEETIEEMRAAVGDDGLGGGPWTDSRLDMSFNKDDYPDFDQILAASDRGEFMVKLHELHSTASPEEQKNSTYAHQARGIAELIERHARINEKLARRKDYLEDTVDANPDMPKAIERFFGTHGSVTESFLMEVIRRQKGDEPLQDFIAQFPNGFPYNAGMDVDIANDASGLNQSVHIRVKVPGKDAPYVFDEDVPLKLVEAIISDFSPSEK